MKNEIIWKKTAPGKYEYDKWTIEKHEGTETYRKGGSRLATGCRHYIRWYVRGEGVHQVRFNRFDTLKEAKSYMENFLNNN